MRVPGDSAREESSEVAKVSVVYGRSLFESCRGIYGCKNMDFEGGNCRASILISEREQNTQKMKKCKLYMGQGGDDDYVCLRQEYYRFVLVRISLSYCINATTTTIRP